MSKEVLLDVRHLTQQFHLTKKIKVKAVDDVPISCLSMSAYIPAIPETFRNCYP